MGLDAPRPQTMKGSVYTHGEGERKKQIGTHSATGRKENNREILPFSDWLRNFSQISVFKDLRKHFERSEKKRIGWPAYTLARA